MCIKPCNVDLKASQQTIAHKRTKRKINQQTLKAAYWNGSHSIPPKRGRLIREIYATIPTTEEKEEEIMIITINFQSNINHTYWSPINDLRFNDKMYFIDGFPKTFFNLNFEYAHDHTHAYRNNAINCSNHNELVPNVSFWRVRTPDRSLAHSIYVVFKSDLSCIVKSLDFLPFRFLN